MVLHIYRYSIITAHSSSILDERTFTMLYILKLVVVELIWSLHVLYFCRTETESIMLCCICHMRLKVDCENMFLSKIFDFDLEV